jgi:hypothetical protein
MRGALSRTTARCAIHHDQRAHIAKNNCTVSMESVSNSWVKRLAAFGMPDACGSRSSGFCMSARRIIVHVPLSTWQMIRVSIP